MELLAPAGGFEQLHAALAFGADAVYLGANRFSMRARAANFTLEELPQAVRIAHDAHASVHLTCNVMMMPEDIKALPSFLEQVHDAGVDALIIGDIGVVPLARAYAPRCALHVSTQASVANAEAAKMWHALGASRIVCAREMTLSDIALMREDIPDDLEIEAFVHGAQCMALSGRCLISSYLTGRSGNKGHCTQPCRWKYTLEEEKRPDVHFPVVEDENGTFLMNAKDLCMVSHLRELEQAGVDSIKIEGRNKKAFYVATVVNAYRQALSGAPASEMEEELRAISHRPYSTGFYFGEPEQADDFDGYEQETMHVADVRSSRRLEDGADGAYEVELLCRNRFAVGETLEVLSPSFPIRAFEVGELAWKSYADKGDAYRLIPVDVANRSKEIYRTTCDFELPSGSFVRARRYRRSARH